MHALTPLFLAPAALCGPQEADDPWQALAEGTLDLRLRYRLEHVDADALPEEALASTLRTVLGYHTGEWSGLWAKLEFEDVTAIGDDDYNSTVNGKTDHAVVADPEGTEVNQAYLGYNGEALGWPWIEAKAGLQEIVLDNARFLGNVGWRQNHQSFEALRLDLMPDEGIEFTYAFVRAVHRIFGDESPLGDEDMASHLFHAGYDLPASARATAYAYLLDFDDSVALSTTTWGGRLAGEARLGEDLGLWYAGEYARQSDAGDNPADVDADYLLGELGLRGEPASLTLGRELLSGSGDPGDKFTTPLATGHKFNGFADLFLATPDTGLEDLYLTLTTDLGPAAARASYHDFRSDSGGVDYGTELDIDLSLPVDEHLTLGLKFARFEADEAFADTTKVMAWVDVTAP